MNVALVHDYLREYGGAERVVEGLHEIFPEAPVYVASYKPEKLGVFAQRTRNWKIKTSWFDKLHLPNKLISPFRIFAPLMFESFDLKEFDVVISSSNSYFAKAVKTTPKQLHLSYVHSPPRYLYGYTTSFNYKKHLWTRIAAELANHLLRIWDFQISQRPDILIANSQNVAKRIDKFYRRDSVIIHPPIDITEFSKNKKEKGRYYLSLNRLVRGKGTEIAIAACTRLSLPLKVAGNGPELENLKKIAGKSVEFLGEVTDEERGKLYSQAIALICASEDEDFGITPVEAMAAGTPVIAMRAGGYIETVKEGETGQFFDPSREDSKEYVNEKAVENLINVLKDFDPKKYQEEDLRKQAEKFSKERFKKEVLELIEKSFPKK